MDSHGKDTQANPIAAALAFIQKKDAPNSPDAVIARVKQAQQMAAEAKLPPENPRSRFFQTVALDLIYQNVYLSEDLEHKKIALAYFANYGIAEDPNLTRRIAEAFEHATFETPIQPESKHLAVFLGDSNPVSHPGWVELEAVFWSTMVSQYQLTGDQICSCLASVYSKVKSSPPSNASDIKEILLWMYKYKTLLWPTRIGEMFDIVRDAIIANHGVDIELNNKATAASLAFKLASTLSEQRKLVAYADCYAYGWGIPKDITKAFEIFCEEYKKYKTHALEARLLALADMDLKEVPVASRDVMYDKAASIYFQKTPPDRKKIDEYVEKMSSHDSPAKALWGFFLKSHDAYQLGDIVTATESLRAFYLHPTLSWQGEITALTMALNGAIIAHPKYSKTMKWVYRVYNHESPYKAKPIYVTSQSKPEEVLRYIQELYLFHEFAEKEQSLLIRLDFIGGLEAVCTNKARLQKLYVDLDQKAAVSDQGDKIYLQKIIRVRLAALKEADAKVKAADTKQGEISIDINNVIRYINNKAKEIPFVYHSIGYAESAKKDLSIILEQLKQIKVVLPDAAVDDVIADHTDRFHRCDYELCRFQNGAKIAQQKPLVLAGNTSSREALSEYYFTCAHHLNLGSVRSVENRQEALTHYVYAYRLGHAEAERVLQGDRYSKDEKFSVRVKEELAKGGSYQQFFAVLDRLAVISTSNNAREQLETIAKEYFRFDTSPTLLDDTWVNNSVYENFLIARATQLLLDILSRESIFIFWYRSWMDLKKLKGYSFTDNQSLCALLKRLVVDPFEECFWSEESFSFLQGEGAWVPKPKPIGVATSPATFGGSAAAANAAATAAASAPVSSGMGLSKTATDGK